MQTLRSSVLLSLTCALTTTLLTACGGGDGTAATTSTTTTTPTTTDNTTTSGATTSGSSTGSSSGTTSNTSSSGSTTGTSTGSTGSTTGSTTSPTATAPTAPTVAFTNTACTAGSGTDYQVGAGKPYTTLADVPWESLKAGDTVRIFYSATPYAGKFLIAGTGTAAAPIRVCGVKGPNGERPIITGANAPTRTALAGLYGNTDATRIAREERGIVSIQLDARNYMSFPSYIQIDGLRFQSAHPSYNYVDATGTTRPYATFGAAIVVERGHNITIADNEITDSTMAIYSKSTDDGDFMVTKDLDILGNTMWNNGIAGAENVHTTYTESHRVRILWNHYGPLRTGALGNSVKDRSPGLYVAYNYIEEGAHAIDIVESEDFPTYALAQADYRKTYVYGNVIKKNGETGSFVHYGGDHFGAPAGANWGEAYFRRGTLYFFNNTVIAYTDPSPDKHPRYMQLSTTLETAEVFNNVFWYSGPDSILLLRQAENDALSSAYTRSGIVNWGVNVMTSGWADVDPWHTITGASNGTSNIVSVTTAPLDTSTFIPVAGGPLVDKAVATPLPVEYQYSGGTFVKRSNQGAGMDIGAVER